MEAVELDYLRLSYRPDLHLLFLRWARPVSSAEHRAGYEAALALAREKQCSHWLVDLRTRGLAAPEDFQWVLTTFRPQLRGVLPAPRRLAYLVTPYQAETIDSRLAAQEGTLPEEVRRGADVRIFVEELPAQHWLQLGT
ncbi:hypothetical protein LJ737_02860 [Hymenobacter sp. 15J16-1T3B]|uniref:hypothetical protein n=1 Tax=Hymenobacter sp. 15J16-1T3B TaxID=2886941 RepID=UPI001D0F8919|nr:hypothetical protein [Hymenobacter sp. 15J16-1T3B]MCC3156158.1 hypothetical protein [Hymenobacter sp. 15J16-1T3B]